MSGEKINLLPCPFCGKKPVERRDLFMWVICCRSAVCHATPYVLHESQKIAAKRWNRRKA